MAQARLGDLYASGEDGVRYPFHLLALVHQIPFRAIRADHLDHQVRAQPVAVLTARIRAVAEQQQIGFAELAFAHAQPQRREQDHAASRQLVNADAPAAD